MSFLDKVVSYLPTIATALTNPIAGVAQLAADFLGPKLGCPSTVDAISQRIGGMTPDEMVKLKELDTQLAEHLSDNGLRLATLDSQDIATVNATMQVEAKSENWIQWFWRPFSGLLFAPTIIVYYIVLPAFKIVLPPIDPMVWTMWGTVIGITAWHRGVGQNIVLRNGNGH